MHREINERLQRNIDAHGVINGRLRLTGLLIEDSIFELEREEGASVETALFFARHALEVLRGFNQ